MRSCTQVKELSLEEIQAVYAQGQTWLLYKRNEQEAVIECHDIDYCQEVRTNAFNCA